MTCPCSCHSDLQRLQTAYEADAEWRHRWHQRLGRGNLTEGKFYEHLASAQDERAKEGPRDSDLLMLRSILKILDEDKPEGLNWPGVARLIRKCIPDPPSSSGQEGQRS